MAKNLTKEEFKKILSSEDILREDNLELFQRIYSSPNHAAKAGDIARAMGKKGKTPHVIFHLQIQRLSKRLNSNGYDISYEERSKQDFKWYTLFFEEDSEYYGWVLRKPLIQAMEELGMTGTGDQKPVVKRKLVDIYSYELKLPETNYFILDSGQHDKDVDFEEYTWKKSLNNKISEGDLFVYRKPQKISGTKGFYFSGVGKIGSVNGVDRVVAKINKPHPFSNPIFQKQLESFQWQWKNRGDTWEHFWNQYGINQIPKEDFLNLISLVDGNYYSEEDEEQVKLDLEIADENYFVEDSQAITSSRPWQGAWSRRVKGAYAYQCAICAISTAEFLVSSHIIPVGDGKHKDKRKDPSNGICLCSIHDKAFDGGYLTVTEDLKVKVSVKAKSDKILFSYLEPFDGSTIKKALKYSPKAEYLQYHKKYIFLG